MRFMCLKVSSYVPYKASRRANVVFFHKIIKNAAISSNSLKAAYLVIYIKVMKRKIPRKLAIKEHFNE